MLLASSEEIKVDGVTIRVEGDLNLNGFLGLDTDVLKEYEKMKVFIDIEGNITNEEKQKLVLFAKRSPIYNTMVKPIAVNVSLDS